MLKQGKTPSRVHKEAGTVEFLSGDWLKRMGPAAEKAPVMEKKTAIKSETGLSPVSEF